MLPSLYIKNALKIAKDGLGDGTVYASATGATPDQANKRFTLTGLFIIADLGADADDKFNGYILYFPASQNKYHIVDWEAAQDRATTFEVPDIIDTGACEIRRSLYNGNTLASNPAFMLIDGILSTKYKASSSNQTMNIDVCLPNLVGQGGFEELAAGAFPSTEQPKGKWYAYDASSDWSVASVSALLGSKMAVWTVPGINQNHYIVQRLPLSVKKGKTYRILLKVQSVTGSSSSDSIRVHLLNDLTGIPGTGTKIAIGWDTDGIWNLPAITTTATWLSSDFIPDFDSDICIWIQGIYANRGSATAIRIDEIYIWEVVNVAALLAFNHNWNGSIANPATTVVYGFNASRSRTSMVNNIDFFATATVNGINGTGPFLVEFGPSIYPIYVLEIPGNSNFQYEAGEILLCEKFSPNRYFQEPFDPYEEEQTLQVNEAISGAFNITIKNQRKLVTAELRFLNNTDRDKFLNLWKPYHFDRKNPFVIKLDATSDPLLVIDPTGKFEMPMSGPRPSIKLRYKQVIA